MGFDTIEINLVFDILTIEQTHLHISLTAVAFIYIDVLWFFSFHILIWIACITDYYLAPKYITFPQCLWERYTLTNLAHTNVASFFKTHFNTIIDG